MAPKKAPAGEPSRKSKAPPTPKQGPKTTAATAAKKKTAPTAESTKKRAASTSTSTPEPVPTWDQNIRSQAQREKKRFKLSRAAMNEDVDEKSIADLAVKLIGESRDTWGIPELEPLGAIPDKKVRRAPGFFEAQDNWLDLVNDMREKMGSKLMEPNSPERSPILRVALEVREVIYKHLLVRSKPVLLRIDWTTVERNPFVDHRILFACKQFAIEGSAFLYRNNTFQALLRKFAYQIRRVEAPSTIVPVHHVGFRNLIIDCARDCWNIKWHEKMAKGLTTLVSAKAVINNLTLQVNPHQLPTTETALGKEVDPVAFADFLWYYGPLMSAIRMLAPRVLKVIVKKGADKRFGMSVDMKYLQRGHLQEGPLANRESIRLRNAQLRWVEGQLKSLKPRLEAIFEDDERAVMEGLCTSLMNSSGVVKQATNEVVISNEQAVAEKGVKEEPIEISSDEECTAKKYTTSTTLRQKAKLLA